jgi:hypothetical protein
MLSRIWSSNVPASKCILQPFRSLSVSCVQFQTNSSQDRNAPKSFFQKLKEYPELHRLHKESVGHGYKEFWAKLRAEPELLRAKQEESRRLNRRYVETSPTARAKKLATARAYFQAHKHDETYLRYKSISRWFFCLPDRSRNAWARQYLPWKTHLPVEYPEKSYHFYSCCGTDRFLKSGVSYLPDYYLMARYSDHTPISGNQKQIRPSFFATHTTQRAAGMPPCLKAMKMPDHFQRYVHVTENYIRDISRVQTG